ncbi:ATP-binding protein [Aquabacterium sp.]|uniref:ATP-binding protein n=1 Tax=Aquabacterium sp. TaxID=1872578 RepID=UPI0037833C55
MLQRRRLEDRLHAALARSRAVALVGPRQSGKTTLARQLLAPGEARYFDLENPLDEARLAQPMTVLPPLQDQGGLIVIDEVQRAPALFPVLRVLIDRSPRNGQFLLLGSASPALLSRAGESLLGRLEVVEVGGFDLGEVGAAAQDRLWMRGGYPLAFLAGDDAAADAWRSNAIRQLVETDLPRYGIQVPAPAMLRFWRMLAHLHGQIWNAADPARSLGVSEPTVRRYLDHLTQTFMVRQLQPWFENLGKRQVKSPKVYFRDSGLLHSLLGVRSAEDLLLHPRSGASWEGFALEQVLRLAEPDEAYFWATHAGAELDLLLLRGGRRVGVEFKRADAPRPSASMHIAMQDLKLDALYVVYPGQHRYALADRMEAVPLSSLLG